MKSQKPHPIAWLNAPGRKGETWNPVPGCSKIGVGCLNCYAARMATRLAKNPLTPRYHGLAAGGNWTGVVRLDEEKLVAPFHWKSPRFVFVNSMGDLFHENVPDEWIERVWCVMADTPHVYIILTKRYQRMREWVTERTHCGLYVTPNIILGASASTQPELDAAVKELLNTPAACRALSLEPLTEGASILTAMNKVYTGGGAESILAGYTRMPRIDWPIAGGETGPGARPMNPDWPRRLRDECAAAGVPFFFKGWGEWFPRDQWEWNPESVLPDDCDAYTSGPGTFVFHDEDGDLPMHWVGAPRSGHLLDGCEHREYPEILKGRSITC